MRPIIQRIKKGHICDDVPLWFKFSLHYVTDLLHLYLHLVRPVEAIEEKDRRALCPAPTVPSVI